MRMMDELAEAMKRTTTVTVITHNVSSGGGGGGAPATIAELPPVSGSELGQYAPQGLGGPINIPSGEGRIFAEMAAASEAGRIREYAAGGWVAGMGAKPAVVHGGEYVLSGDMLAGRQPVDSEVMRALAKGGQSIQVTAQTNADPYAISREIAWAMKVGVA
jgi:hypothetical protein